MKIPVFASTIRQIDQFINTKGLNVVKIITDSSKSITENIINEYVGITAIQVSYFLSAIRTFQHYLLHSLIIYKHALLHPKGHMLK